MSANDFFDTNVLVYLVTADAEKADAAEQLVASGGTVSVQVLNEFASVMTRKFDLPLPSVRDVLQRVQHVCRVVPLGLETHELGLEIAESHLLAIYDAMIVAAALQSGCRILYTEDLHDGLRIGELTIRNPFR